MSIPVLRVQVKEGAGWGTRIYSVHMHDQKFSKYNLIRTELSMVLPPTFYPLHKISSKYNLK